MSCQGCSTVLHVPIAGSWHRVLAWRVVVEAFLGHPDGFGAVEGTGCSVYLAWWTRGAQAPGLVASRHPWCLPELRCPTPGTLAVRMARCLRAPGLRAAGCGCGARGLFVDFVWFHATCFRARQQLGLPRPRCAGRRGIRSQNDVWGTRLFPYMHVAPFWPRCLQFPSAKRSWPVL